MEYITELACNIESKKLIHMHESVLDNIFLFESDGDFESTFKKLKEATLEVIKKVLDMIAEFCKTFKEEIQIRCEQIKLQNKMAEIKSLLAGKRSVLSRGRVSIIAITRYKIEYRRFINMYTREIIKGVNRTFNTVEEYENWRDGVISKLDDFQITLTDEERWKLSERIEVAVKLTDEEIENRDKTMKMLREEGEEPIKSLREYYYDNAHKSLAENPTVQGIIARLKSSFVGQICNKLARCIRTAIKFVMNHTFKAIALIIAALIIL